MEEREISIIDLIVDILLHWRMFIVWMLVGAVVLGAFGFMRSNNTVKQQNVQLVEINQEPEEWLTEEEIQNVNYVINCEAAYRAQEAFRAESLLMKLDFNHVNKAEVTMAVTSGDYQESCGIERVYEDILQSSELVMRIAEDNGMEISDVSGMILLDREAGDEGEPTFRIKVMHSDENQCKNMLETVIIFLKEKQPEIESVFGEHELAAINRSYGVGPEVEIAAMQKTRFDDAMAMKKAALDAKGALSEKEQLYYSLLIGKDEGKILPAAGSAPGISIKYVIFGTMIATFIYAFILLLIYIFNAKIRAIDNLQELYDISQLGMIPTDRNYKRFFGFIDKWLISVRNHNKRQFMPEKALELAIVAVKMAAGKEELYEICLMGCGLKERALDTCEKMKAQLEKDGVQVKILNNVLYDAQALEELDGVEGVVLVEGVGITLYNEISEELELLKRQEIKVLGGILVE